MLALLTEQNRPFNVQTLVDFLATQGVKKAAIQKALDALVERKAVALKVGRCVAVLCVLRCVVPVVAAPLSLSPA